MIEPVDMIQHCGSFREWSLIEQCLENPQTIVPDDMVPELQATYLRAMQAKKKQHRQEQTMWTTAIVAAIIVVTVAMVATSYGGSMVETMIKNKLAAMGAKLIEFNQYNSESYLYTVMADWNGQSVCWVFNAQCKGLYWGVYGNRAADAYKQRVSGRF